jgi:hypothetical protein
MNKRLITMALGVLSVPALGGLAYGAAHSVSDNPRPQVVIPASTSRSADDPATHDVNDDHGVDVTTSTTNTTVSDDNPATHDVGDDGVDNPATHDVGDDDGGRTTPTTVSNSGPGSSNSGPGSVSSGSGSDDPATHDVGDDHGGTSGSSSGSSGSGSSGSGSGGSDDGASHT